MFNTDSRTETFLAQMGVLYKYSNNLTFADLARGWNEKNLARPVAIREEAVLEYALLMENGSPAPAPILHDSDKGHDVLDGVQRLSAAQMRNSTKWSAYLVTCDSDDTLMAIRMLANARLQGHPEPPEWTKRQAVDMLVVERGMSASEVAQMGGWKTADVARLAKILDWGFQIRCIGGPVLPDTIVETISQHVSQEELKSTPEPIASLCHTLKRARLSNSEATPFIEAFFQPITKSNKRHDIYMARLSEVTDNPEVETRLLGRRSAPLPRHVALIRTLKAANTIAEEIANGNDSVPYVDEFFRLLKSIGTHIRCVAKQHPTAKTAPTPADLWSRDAPD